MQDPSLILRASELLRAFPGYTLSTLLAEPAEHFEALWAIEMAKRKVESALAK